jgi:hypothetical protein
MICLLARRVAIRTLLPALPRHDAQVEGLSKTEPVTLSPKRKLSCIQFPDGLSYLAAEDCDLWGVVDFKKSKKARQRLWLDYPVPYAEVAKNTSTTNKLL